MKTVLQKVTQASVHVDGALCAEIGHGALLLVGVETTDTQADADATAAKIAKLRFFPGATPMDQTAAQIDGEFLVVSQFTLAGHVKKGNRPSFTDAARPEVAEPLYMRVVEQLRAAGLTARHGVFGGDMQVSLTNDGPVTLFVFTSEGRVI